MQCTGAAGNVPLTKQSIPATAVIATVPSVRDFIRLAFQADISREVSHYDMLEVSRVVAVSVWLLVLAHDFYVFTEKFNGAAT